MLVKILIIFLPLAIFAETYKGLTVEPEVVGTYDRWLYKHWIDVDRDGQRTRTEVLIQESLIPVTLSSNGKKVTTGLWVGPYTGLVTRSPSDLQIDHMIPLREAHKSGAHAWTEQQRQDYANDMTNANHLIAVRGRSNSSKGARDPAEWMPPNRAYWCEYLENWVKIKQNYGLSIDRVERDALKFGFSVCDKYQIGDRLRW